MEEELKIIPLEKHLIQETTRNLVKDPGTSRQGAFVFSSDPLLNSCLAFVVPLSKDH